MKTYYRLSMYGVFAFLIAFGFFKFTLSKQIHKSQAEITKNLKADSILIEKQKRTLSLIYKGKILKTYPVALGFSPNGHKECEGDGKTPEGNYFISSKNPYSTFYLSLKISYPNPKDILNAKNKGCAPGGDIMIHGLGKKFAKVGKLHLLKDWTLGCIAVTNEEIEEIYKATPVGTRVEIKS